jgi:calcineurin-like phosphoesterase family protein
VYHLGDFGWKNFAEALEQLNGQIILVKGSHDFNNEIKHKKIIKVERLINTRIEKQPITLCHYCMKVWHLSHYNSWHLYGHSHGRLKPVGKAWDVGVDCNNYFPLSWEEIKDIMKNRSNNFNFVHKELKI